MKSLILATLLILLLCSCSDNFNDLSGRYMMEENTVVTTIQRITDTDYEIISPDGKIRIPVKRKGYALYGTFEGKSISCDFNSSFDAIIAKEDNKVIFKAKKIKY
ncbi:MAG: hypothetical protein JST57_09645 [Bacteroidetes bacterium]|nr:hypothetical protein [Bacteroidota bacterium]